MMDVKQMEAMVRQADAIDAGAAAYETAAAEGNLDEKGNVLPPPDPVDLTAEKAAQWAIIPQTLAWAITAVFPETAPAYTPEKCMELANAIVPVADKYGWNGPGNSPELGLVLASAFFSMPAYMAYKTRQAAKAEAEAKKEPKIEGAEPLQVINGSRE